MWDNSLPAFEFCASVGNCVRQSLQKTPLGECGKFCSEREKERLIIPLFSFSGAESLDSKCKLKDDYLAGMVFAKVRLLFRTSSTNQII